MASGSTTLSSPTARFASSDVGKPVLVTGAGSSSSAPLITTIKGYTSATKVTLGAAAGTSVNSATVFWGTDDTASLQSALNAGGHVAVPRGVTGMMVISSVSPVAHTILDLTGITVLQIQGANQAAIFEPTASDPGLIDEFSVIGGTFLGHGQEQANNNAIVLCNVSDVSISGTTVTGYNTGAFYLADVHRCRVADCTIMNSTPNGGLNEINVVFLLTGVAANAPTDILIDSNFVSTGGVAPICVTGSSAVGGENPSAVRAVITGNDVTTGGFAGIALELGGTAISRNVHEVMIANNSIHQTGTAATAWGIQVTNDSSQPSTDPAILQYISVANNVVNSQQNGIESQASWCAIQGNVIIAAENGIVLQGHGGVQITHNHVADNILHLPDGGAGTGIFLAGVSDSQINDNDVSFTTGTSGTSDGIFIVNCNRVKLGGLNQVSLAPQRALHVAGGGDIVIDGIHVYNPCSSGGIEAIRFTGAMTGTNAVRFAHCVDDRGSGAKMKYAINNAATSGSVYKWYCTGTGWVASSSLGTFANNASIAV